MNSRSQHVRSINPITQIVFGFVIALATAIINLSPEGQPVPTSPLKSPSCSSDEPHKLRIADSYGKLPLRFEPNGGQADEAAKFISHGMGG